MPRSGVPMSALLGPPHRPSLMPTFDQKLSPRSPYTFPLLGVGLAHSRAPTLHNFLFEKSGAPFRYEILDTADPSGFLELLQANKKLPNDSSANISSNINTASEDSSAVSSSLPFLGAAVTMPYKVQMTKHVDSIDENAAAVGAINTIYVRQKSGHYINVGTNTDTVGVRDSILVHAGDIVEQSVKSGRPGLVYGGGGACRLAVYALSAYLQCPTIYVVNRFASEVEELAKSMKEGGFSGEIVHILSPEMAHGVEAPLLAVLTVPDFEPQSDEEKLARSTLQVFMDRQKGAVLEMCYHPNPVTVLSRAFESLGWRVISGVEAMIYQGIAQQVLWTGRDFSDVVGEVRRHIYDDLGIEA